MKKAMTTKSHFEQINLALVYVQNNFDSIITVEELAKISAYSVFHFHRIFKEVTGQSVNNYIRNTRLEKASNLLLYNNHKSIQMIALECGFSTATSFTQAFKKMFSMTPKDWKKGGYTQKNSKKTFSMIEADESIIINPPEIVNSENIPILYTRVYKYENDISLIWHEMHEWCEAMNILEKPHKYIGLFHNHPSFLPYNTMRYSACIRTDEDINPSGKVGRCNLSCGKFAKFKFNCSHQELYKMMHLAYINWLQGSKYEVRNFPAYVEYKNPEYLMCNGVLEVDFYLPIQIIL